jgi:hypothetical protein
MQKPTALLCLFLGVLTAVTSLAAEARAEPDARELVVAQDDRRVPNIFRFLFRDRRHRVAPAPRQTPLQILPRRQRDSAAPRRSREAATPRRERRNRPAAPAPREVAAVEKAADAKRVLVVGDFMAGALAKGLAEAHAENPNVVVIDATSGSSGLVRADYYDWPAKLGGLVEEQKPDAILVLVGANDRQTMRTEAGAYEVGSDGWRTAYAARVASFADALKAAARPVLWAGLVPVSSSAMSRDYSGFNGIYREQLEAKSMRFIETWNGFADEEGKYVSVGPDVRGQTVQLRGSDGINFTRAGQRKLAFFVEQELNEILGGGPAFVAAVDPEAAGSTAPGEQPPQIGPMVPIEALTATGGELSAGAPREAGGATATIAVGLEGAAAPPGRVDNYAWPPPVSAPAPPPSNAQAPPPSNGEAPPTPGVPPNVN